MTHDAPCVWISMPRCETRAHNTERGIRNEARRLRRPERRLGVQAADSIGAHVPQRRVCGTDAARNPTARCCQSQPMHQLVCMVQTQSQPSVACSHTKVAWRARAQSSALLDLRVVQRARHLGEQSRSHRNQSESARLFSVRLRDLMETHCPGGRRRGSSSACGDTSTRHLDGCAKGSDCTRSMNSVKLPKSQAPLTSECDLHVFMDIPITSCALLRSRRKWQRVKAALS